MRLVVLAALVCVAFATQKSYEGYKVMRINPTEEQYALLMPFEDHEGFDFWKEPHAPGEDLDIMVAPAQQETFIEFLKDKSIPYSVLQENVQKLLDSEAEYQRSVVKSPRSISFNTYHRFNVINSYLDQLAARYPNLVSLQTIGRSNAGRELKLIRISSGGSGTRPAILIEGGIHAREWISPAMCLYIINQLVENNAANSALTNGVDWYILPVLNPDGYEFSHTNSRMWRKTRSPNTGSTCIGADGNRNFGYYWMATGASNNPCSETFAGRAAFSEPETSALRDFALANRNQIKMFLSIHSYGNYLLYPWGYTSALPSDWRTLQTLAEQANAAHVAAGGASYRIGSSTNVLYAAAGISPDYMKGVVGIDLSYTIELTNTIFGFQLPASQIQQTVTRFFAAIRVFGNYVRQNN